MLAAYGDAMSMSLVESPNARQSPRTSRILQLTLLFWLFSYAFHAMRGAMLEEQWSVLLSMRRALAVTAGAAAYWIVLKKLDATARVELGKVVGWIVTATLAVLLARLAIDQLISADPLPPLRNVRWTLAWSAYFGLWVMGAIAFHRGLAELEEPPPTLRSAPPQVRPAELRPMAHAVPSQARIEPSDGEWLIDAIIPELLDLGPEDRAEAARRVLTAGGYELAEENDPWSRRHNARARLALRIAARLAEPNRR